MEIFRQQSSDRKTHLVLFAFILFTAQPFLFAATHASFWKHEHSTAPIAAAVVAALLVALVLRQRWAWLLLVLLYGGVLISYAFAFTDVVAFIANAISFMLLVSRPMRRYVSRASPSCRGVDAD